MRKPVKFAKTALLLMGAVVSVPALSQTSGCKVTDSFNDCFGGLQDKMVSADVAIAADEAAAAKELSLKNTGSQNGAGTATEDFNPRLQISADTLGVSGDGGDGITLAWNDVFRDILKNRFFGDDGAYSSARQHHKLIVKLEEAKLFEPLKETIADAELRDQFENELDDFDDISVDFRFSLNSRRFGRDIQSHDSFISDIQRVAMEEVEIADANALRIRLMFEAGELIPGGTTFDDNATLASQLGTKASEFIDKFDAFSNANESYVDDFNAATRKHGLADLINLVNNQPQLVLSVKGNVRDDLVGPDEYSATLTYELGGVNLNRFRKFQVRCIKEKEDREDDETKQTELWKANANVGCLKNYIQRNRASAESGDRLAFSLEYKHKEDYDFAESGFALNLDSESSLIANLTYGRYLDLGLSSVGGKGAARFDIVASYEDVGGDPMRQDRTLATASLSQEVGQGLFLTVGLSWADKPEYRVEADKDVSVRVGLSYKLSRD